MKPRVLLIMRHAKSDWSANADDFDRPLNPRGLKSAKKMGKWLKKQKISPDYIVSSPAKRAKQTIEIVCEQLGDNTGDIVWDERIYNAGLEDLFNVIREHGENANCLLLTGHNPGLDYLVNHLAKEYPPRNASGKLMTTAAIAVMDFGEPGFSDTPGTAEVVEFVRPKEL